MKIKAVTVRGFRGFNQEQTIVFHPTLTLIYGQNSYGKTSIIEAIEWLLYRKTSKVDKGESKEEYKGSYRNCHLDQTITTSVSTLFLSNGKPLTFQSELIGEEESSRTVDGNPVDQWPIDTEAAAVSRPFIMQHALKYLLLVGPTDRFKGFARLLSLDELGDLQSDFVSVCTKPEASIPSDVAAFRTHIATLESRLAACSTLKQLYNLFKKGKDSYNTFATCLLAECKNRVAPSVTDDSVLPNLLKIRDEAVKKVFSGSITLTPYTSEDKSFDSADLKYFVEFASDEIIKKYCELLALTTREAIVRQAEFYKTGLDLLAMQPSICPFCGQKIDDPVAEHIKAKHQETSKQTDRATALLEQKRIIVEALSELGHRLEKCQSRHISRLSTFLTLGASLDKLGKILLPKYETHFNSTRDTITQATKIKKDLEEQYNFVLSAINAVQASVQKTTENATLVKNLGKSLISYSAMVQSSSSSISSMVTPMADANQILKHELDSVAGTEDISMLIDLREKLKDIKKSFELDSILDGLKELRRIVEQYVGTKMWDAVTNEMTGDVMNWYNQIRTKGDPDVHFSGFDMERTRKGDIKSRRVQIKASSYGVDLISAVSSLSESKLNALGLCMSIATNLKPGCPFGFLFIDDPIQSWDIEHSAQFIEIVQKLTERGKQVVLLSHNHEWIQQVRTGCRRLNGYYYEITSYTKNGPNIEQKPWCTWKQRLDEIDAILNDATADTVRLQHAEQEVRLVISDLTSTLYSNKKNIHKDANKLNSNHVRKCLVECSLPDKLVDHITQTFETTDDSHHVTNYTPVRDRIRTYHGYATELAKYL